jgi:AraC-like DNA-binding protein
VRPGVTVAALAAQLHTSVSTLHRAFAGEPASIAEWIRARRLDAVGTDLCDPALRHRSISDLAFAWGFSDASHFSRAFRARFGATALQVRAGACTDARH